MSPVQENSAAAGATPPPSRVAGRAYLVADVAATALFGIEGALTAAAARFDLLGILTVGICTALGGGVVRDVLMGDTPPAAFRSPARIVAALAGSLAAFALFAALRSIPHWPLIVIDAAALSLFAVTGADKASRAGSNLWIVTLLGTVTATGGGILRDILLTRTPVVLTADIYATAAMAGSLAVGIALRLRITPVVSMAIGFVICLALRLAAAAFGWHLPRAL